MTSVPPVPQGLFRRWLKFNAVGGVGIVVQLVVLALAKSVLGLHYLVATTVAVESAVLHNFLWHERWTWADRTRDAPGVSARVVRLLKFNLTNGLISIVANVLLMRLFVGQFHLHYLAANILSIAVCSLANFLASDRFVFARREI